MIKKTTAIVAVVLFVILFTAGSVAAVYLIKSETNVDHNDIDDQYIYISFSAPDTSEYSDLLSTVSFDTVNSGGTASYVLHCDEDWFDTDGINDVAKISTTHTMRVDSTNGGNTFSLDVTVTDFTPVAGLTYYLKVGSQYVAGSVASHNTGINDTATGFGWTLDGLACDTDLTVDLYVGGTPTEDPGATVGFTNYDNSDPQHVVTGSVFTFVAYATVG